MSRYTTTLAFLMQHQTTPEAFEYARSQIFNFDYEYYSGNEEEKKKFEIKFIRRYLMLEINFDTWQGFREHLHSYLDIKAPEYMEMYLAQHGLDPFTTPDFTTTREVLSKNKSDSIDKTKSDTKTKNTGANTSTKSDNIDTSNSNSGTSTDTNKGTTLSTNETVDTHKVVVDNTDTEVTENTNKVIGTKTTTNSDDTTVTDTLDTKNIQSGTEINNLGEVKTTNYGYNDGNMVSMGGDGGSIIDPTINTTEFNGRESKDTGSNVSKREGANSTTETYSDDYSDQNNNILFCFTFIVT